MAASYSAREAADSVGSGAVPSASWRLHHLDRDLDHQPVVLAQVEPRELHDPPQALAERVRVDVERLGGGADVAATAQELLERSEERGRALAVVVGDPRDGLPVRVAHAAVERHPEEVLVRAELVVGHHARRAQKHGRPEERVRAPPRSRPGSSRPAADVRDADRDGPVQLRLEPAQRLEQPLLPPGGTRSSARIESSRRSKSEPGRRGRERLLEVVAAGLAAITT